MLDQVNVDENPAFADLGAGNLAGAGLLLERHWMDVQERSGGLEIERVHRYAIGVCSDSLPSEIDRRNLFATMAHLVADRLARLAIDRLLFGRELLRLRPALSRTLPAGELLVARLCVMVPVSVERVDAGSRALVSEVSEILSVCDVAGRNQALPLGYRLGLLEELPLLGGPDPNLALTPALGPRVLEHQRISPIRP